MSLIEVHWDILTEEGRVIKAAMDLAKIPCKYVPKDTPSPFHQSRSRDIVDSVSALLLLPDVPQLGSLLGTNEDVKTRVKEAISLHKGSYSPYLRLSIVDLACESNPQLRLERANAKRKEILEGIVRFQTLLSEMKTDFLCGREVSLADLLFYFDVCNTTYFSINPSHYPHLWQWFQRVYAKKEVKIITHQWFAMAKQITPIFRPRRIRPKL